MADPPTPASVFGQESDDEIRDRIIFDIGTPPVFITDSAEIATWNTRVGGLLDAVSISPLVQERRRVLSMAEFVLALGFLQYSQGSYLDAKAAELGVFRLPAVASTCTLTFTGDIGTVIPAGTIASTEGDADVGDPGVAFVTNANVTVQIDGTADVLSVAQIQGAAGNVAPGTVTVLGTTITGIQAVINEFAA